MPTLRFFYIMFHWNKTWQVQETYLRRFSSKPIRSYVESVHKSPNKSNVDCKKEGDRSFTNSEQEYAGIWFLGFQQQLKFFRSWETTFFHGLVFFSTGEMKSLFQIDSNTDDFNVIYKLSSLCVSYFYQCDTNITKTQTDIHVS